MRKCGASSSIIERDSRYQCRLPLGQLNQGCYRVTEEFIKETINRNGPTSPIGEPHEPLEDRFQIGLLQGADAVTGHLAVADVLQVHRIDQLVYAYLLREIGLVPQDKEGNTLETRVTHEGMKLFSGDGKSCHVCNVNDEENRVDASAIPLPHCPEARLTT